VTEIVSRKEDCPHDATVSDKYLNRAEEVSDKHLNRAQEVLKRLILDHLNRGKRAARKNMRRLP